MDPDPTRANGQQNVKRPPRRFQFIDNSNIASSEANSTQVRRHVMQEYMREKRWENRTKAEAGVLGDEVRTPSLPTSPPRRRPGQRSRQGQRQRQRLQQNGHDPNTDSRTSTQSPRSSTSPDLNHAKRVLQTKRVDSQRVQVEDIHRTFPPSRCIVSQRPRRGFYLTPQSFAQIATLLPEPSTMITLAATSGESLPSDSVSDAFGALRSRGSCLDPATILSAARTDPFDSLPMKLNKQDQELFDFYATVMPACSYGFERRSPHAHNWYLSVFIPEAMKSPVAFQNTILVHAANTQAWVQGLSETKLSIEHRSRASEMLLNHVQNHPYDTSDAAISSTLSAAALEDFDPRVERRKYAWMHWRAAVQKIRDRGGPAAITQSKSLRMLINWSDYIFSGYCGDGSTFYFDHSSSPIPNGVAGAADIAKREILQQSQEFIVFLECAERLAVVAASAKHNPLARSNQTMRYTMFEPDMPLFKLIASSNGPRYTKTGQLKQIISRLAALMTINVALWEHRFSPAASEEFLQELADNIQHNDLDRYISVEALIQILLSGSRNPALNSEERPWLVGRLLKVAKRLSRASWEKLNDFLLGCLTLDAAFRPTVQEWKSDLEKEILLAPLSSYVLPLMQDPGTISY